ncbi:MAG: putative LPS assembly protein LptD, partial [Candidatus Kapaibacterium sp.]
KDSVIYNFASRSMRLRGNASLKYKAQGLDAEIIELNFDTSILRAEPATDSAGKMTGFPKFADRGEDFAGEKIVYNFRTNRGTISLGETEMAEGYYFGKKIKRVSESEMFVSDGYYTTCDKPDPHFYFGSPQMKVVAQDRVFLDPIIMYVEDLPVFIFPFGLFFPNQSGRQSGIMIPSFFFSRDRGVAFEDLGVYLALSDYYDTKFSTKLYSKGGYLIENQTRWKLRDVFNGSIDVSYGHTRLNPDDNFNTNWSLRLNHSHEINPQERFNARLSYASQDFNRQTSNNMNQRIERSMTSNAGYTKSFDNGASVSIGYSRDQDIITDDYTQTLPNLSFSMPNLYPLKDVAPSGNWLGDISFSYDGSYNRTDRRSTFHETQKIETSDSTYYDTTRTVDYSHTQKIEHNPRISITPKLGHFNLSPFVSFNVNNYFRRLDRYYDPADSAVVDSYEHGFFSEYDYSLGVNVNTTLYGVGQARMFGVEDISGITAWRHMWKPTIGYSFKPDLTGPSTDFYDTYMDTTGREIQYSRFASDGGGIASKMLQSNLSYSDMHSFEVKVKQGDTLDDKNLKLLTLKFGMSYNFAADSLRLSDLNLNYSSSAVPGLTFNGRAGFTFYDETRRWDSAQNSYSNNFSKIDRFLLSEGKGLARMTSFSLNLQTSFSEDGFASAEDQQPARETKDTVSLGQRFMHRHEDEDDFDLYGAHSPGYRPISVPWTATINLNYSYNHYTLHNVSRRLTLSTQISMELTKSWSMDVTGEYDFINNELLRPNINIRKRLHCWELNFQWYPVGPNRGFYLRFGILATQLRDLKLEKRSSPIY